MTMKLLIIGGTRFLDRHLVTTALARNHEVTLFNRGTESLADVETIVGDRHTEIHKLSDRRWDAVIDTCGHLPRAVRAATEVLADSIDRYVFLSSASAQVRATLSLSGRVKSFCWNNKSQRGAKCRCGCRKKPRHTSRALCSSTLARQLRKDSRFVC